MDRWKPANAAGRHPDLPAWSADAGLARQGLCWRGPFTGGPTRRGGRIRPRRHQANPDGPRGGHGHAQRRGEASWPSPLARCSSPPRGLRPPRRRHGPPSTAATLWRRCTLRRSITPRRYATPRSSRAGGPCSPGGPCGRRDSRRRTSPQSLAQSTASPAARGSRRPLRRRDWRRACRWSSTASPRRHWRAASSAW